MSFEEKLFENLVFGRSRLNSSVFEKHYISYLCILLIKKCALRSFCNRMCLFWVKIISGNAFPKMRLFGWSGKFYFPEIEIRWPKKTAFEHGNAFTLLFSLQSISGKWERERESARARERGEDPGAIASSSSSPRRCRIAMSDRDRAVIAIRDRDRAVDRDPTSRSRRRSRSQRSRRWWFYVFSGLWLLFSDLCFPSSFPNTKHQKIFFGKFFKMQPNTWKYFPFPEISIFGKYVFSGKRFTATKHSLKCYIFQKTAFSRFSIDWTCCSTDRKCDKKLGLNLLGSISSRLVLDLSNVIFDWLNLFFRLIENRSEGFLKGFSYMLITLFIFFKSFLSLLLGPIHLKSIFCRFLPNFSQGFFFFKY